MKALSHKSILIGAGAIVVLAGAITYEIFLPTMYGNSYKKDIQAANQQLHSSLAKVAEGATRPIFTNPESTTGSDKNDIVIIKDSLADAEAKLRAFEESSKKLKSLPFSGYFGSYRQAKQIQQEATTRADKLTKQLASYKDLVSFLDNTNKSMTAFEEQTMSLDLLEAATDVEQISKSLKGSVEPLRTAAREIQNTAAPQDFTDIRDSLATLCNDMAGSMERLSKAFDASNWEDVDAAYAGLLVVMEKAEASSKDFQAKIGQDSKFMRDVKGLPAIASSLN